MKICVSAAGSGLDAPVDQRFGRAEGFVLVETDTMEAETLENPSSQENHGAGVRAAMSGADLVVAVTEPTRSARSDLLRLLDLADHFGIETGLVLNRADLCEDEARGIEEAARDRHVALLGRIPYDESIPRGLSSGRVAVECSPRTSEALGTINRRLLELLGPAGGPALPLHPRTLDHAQEEIIP